MEILETRDDMIKLIPKNLICAELGVFRGQFSEILLKECEPSVIHLVDIFHGHQVSANKDGLNFETCDLGVEYEILKAKYKDNKRVNIVKSRTNIFLESLEDNSLDFVYIDADHSYESVSCDLKLSHKKVKSGGIIAGHDYTIEKFPGVVRAVNEFCDKYNLKIKYLTRDGCPSFLIVKEN